MSETLFEILRLAVMLCAVVVSGLLIPYIKEKASDDRYARVMQWVEIAVHAAQQVLWDKTGSTRKEFVTKQITDYCAQHHIDITTEQISLLIESVVKKMKIEEEKGKVKKE